MENRSLKELYELTLVMFKKQMLLTNSGICASMCHLMLNNEITNDEYNNISIDFSSIRPNRNKSYSWPLYDRQSRIEFLENRIKELSK